MKKADLVKRIMEAFGYDLLSEEAKARTRKYYMNMTVADLETLIRLKKERKKLRK